MDEISKKEKALIEDKINLNNPDPSVQAICKNWFFDEKTYEQFYRCYVIRKTYPGTWFKRGWLFNGSMKEVWIPYTSLRFTMIVYSYYRDIRRWILGHE